MDADEREICEYLKGWRGQFVSATEISRRAGIKARFREEPTWAAPVLTRLVERKILQTDGNGHFCLPKRPIQDKRQKWIAPHIKEILEASGKQFDGVLNIEEPDEFDNL